MRLRFAQYKCAIENGMNKHEARRFARKLKKFTSYVEQIRERLGVDELSEEDIERCRIIVGVK